MIKISMNPESVVLRLNREEYKAVSESVGIATELVQYKSDPDTLKAIYSADDASLYMCLYYATRVNLASVHYVDDSKSLLYIDDQIFFVEVDHQNFLKIMRQYEWFSRSGEIRCNICQPHIGRYHLSFEYAEYDIVCWIYNNIEGIVLR